MKLNEKQKIIVATLVFVVLVGSLIASNVMKFNERKELMARHDNLVAEEKKANDRIAQIPELRKKRANLANIIDQYASILPEEKHIEHDAFADIIDRFSQETQVVIQKVDYLQSNQEEENPDENFIRHRYRLTLVGTFPNFLRFANRIENHERFLKLDDISIKPLGAGTRNVSNTSKNETELLDMASVPFKDIEVTLSTYTYKRD